MGILDSNYNEIVSYEYDSLGALVNITDNSNINIGTINPFRYRSYYYDEETKLYYLNSRYYNPQFGRFINADGYVSTGQGINSANMFMYCGNNPVSREDSIGNSWWSSIKSFFKKKSYRTYGAAKTYREAESTPKEAFDNMNVIERAEKYDNCMSYALDLNATHNPGYKAPTKYIKKYSDYGDINKVTKATKRDLELSGREARIIAGPSGKISANEYRIAIRTTGTDAVNPDYHFMVQTSTGQWAEKHGDAASKLWDYDMTPNTIDWTADDGTEYTSKIVYMAVTY